MFWQFLFLVLKVDEPSESNYINALHQYTAITAYQGHDLRLEYLNMCAMEKATGPDGFPMVFFPDFLVFAEGRHHQYHPTFSSKSGLSEKFQCNIPYSDPKEAQSLRVKRFQNNQLGWGCIQDYC